MVMDVSSPLIKPDLMEYVMLIRNNMRCKYYHFEKSFLKSKIYSFHMSSAEYTPAYDFSDIRERIASLEGELKKISNSLSHNINSLNRRIDELESAVKSLGAQLHNKLDVVFGKLGALESSIKGEVTSLRGDLQHMSSIVSNMQGDVGKLKEQASDTGKTLRKTLEILESIAELLNDVQRDVGVRLENIDKKLAGLRNSADSLKEGLSKWGEAIQTYVDAKSKSEIEIMENEFSKMEGELKTMEQRLIESSKENLNEINATHKGLSETLNRIMNEIAALYNNLKDFAALLEDTRLELVSALDSLTYSVDSYRDAVYLKVLE